MKFTRRFENPTLVEDRTAGLQSLGGLIQPPPALFRVKKIWIWKYAAKIFLILQAFFINLWSRGNHSWLWNQRSCVQIPAVPFLFPSENVSCTEIRTRGLQIQSQLSLPLHHQDWSFDAKNIINVALLERGDDHPMRCGIVGKIWDGE